MAVHQAPHIAAAAHLVSAVAACNTAPMAAPVQPAFPMDHKFSLLLVQQPADDQTALLCSDSYSGADLVLFVWHTLFLGCHSPLSMSHMTQSRLCRRLCALGTPLHEDFTSETFSAAKKLLRDSQSPRPPDQRQPWPSCRQDAFRT